MKENREAVIAWVIKQEVEPGEEATGSYHCDKDDAGGCTKFGIATRSHPDSQLIVRFGHGLKDLTREEAVIVYTEEYWEKIRGDVLQAGLDLIVMDFAVNAGVERANHYVLAARAKTEGEPPLAAIRYFANMRREYYSHLVRAVPRDQKFLHDWLKRTDKAENEATEMSFDAGDIV